MAAKIKKGDRIIVLTGKDKGKTGEVIAAFPTENKVLVSGINLVKRHQRASGTDAGGIVEKEAKINVSNIAIVDPKENKPTRVGFKTLDDGRKVRVAKLSGEVIDN
ncbi:50S ribosomal protein L24 [Thalassospira alkalitolerans]|uniref:Large ribosomal subunit protein uL24 n=1 Tax=Thalassospira alkalitolerans TaxID=1293890 RepID=A0A1Y2LCM7_9PROT|nr:50S ribosomal protein L24 [Thalassospira alkalitolerans]OSQ48116.1 50S ribosomal protein L24 [Thalassospira alkalitolerans]|tara:strand:- start:2273 stop:2590 length:318 start_codon:yes stop_codon:yes gene_type:complete